MHSLLVAATEAEARHLPSGADVLITGMGKTAAAASLARHLAGLSDGALASLQVVNIGTAGALLPHLSGLHEIGTVLNHEINADAIRALGYDPRESLTIGSGPTVLASGDVFVTDPVLRDALALRAQLVDMEGYAVAYVAAEFGVPVRMVKYVSDAADESARDWNEVVDHCARELGDWVSTSLVE
ncbi:nucleosidase [Nocardioides montaniterrae]